MDILDIGGRGRVLSVTQSVQASQVALGKDFTCNVGDRGSFLGHAFLESTVPGNTCLLEIREGAQEGGRIGILPGQTRYRGCLFLAELCGFPSPVY